MMDIHFLVYLNAHLAHRADAVLLFPQLLEPLTFLFPVPVGSFFPIKFPCWIEWIRVALDLDVPLYGCIGMIMHLIQPF